MIIRIGDNASVDPGEKSEDLWDGQVCLSPEGEPFVWDDAAGEPRYVGDETFRDRHSASEHLSGPAFGDVVGVVAEMLYERNDDWLWDEIRECTAVETTLASLDLPPAEFTDRVWDSISEKASGLPEGHFAADVV